MAFLQLFLGFCLYQAIPTLAQHTPQKCSPNQVTMMNLENQYEIKISDVDFNVAFDCLDVRGEKSNRNVTEILLNSADVIVSGHLYPKENYTDSKIERSFNTDSVIVHLTQEDSDNKKVSCKVAGGKHLSKRNNQSRSSLTPQERIDFVLHSLAEACLEIQICEQFNAMLSDVSAIRDHYEQRKSRNPIIPVLRRSGAAKKLVRKLRSLPKKSLQNTVNSMFDYGVTAAISKLVDSNGIYHLPDVVQNFTLAGSTGDFKTSDGTFEGLRSIKRTKDMVFSNNKNHYTMGTTVRLSNAKVNIPSYSGRYGYLKIKGHVILNIHGISLTIKVSIDYNSSPCHIHLDEMSIHDVGDIDVDIDGLGWPLNSAVKLLIRGIVRTTVFGKAKEKIAELASQLDCEKHRPTIQMMRNQD